MSFGMNTDNEVNPKTGKPFKSSWAVRQRSAIWYRENKERADEKNKENYS